MGTSAAYGGSPGWKPVRDDTEEWLDAESPSDESYQSQGDYEGGRADDEGPPAESPPPDPQRIDSSIAKILAGVTGRLIAGVGTGGASGGEGAGGQRGGGTGGGGGGGARRRAAASGGTAIAGVHGLRAGSEAALRDAGLSLADLEGLSPFEQARRIVDAASESAALVEQDEIREVNANFVWWAMQRDDSPEPDELLKAWVTEFVMRTWLTEAGPVLRDGTRNGADTHNREREVRATLEVAASHVELPTDGLRASDFQDAIRQLLEMLHRIFEDDAG